MTNREKIVQELAEMTNGQIMALFAGNPDMEDALNDMMCRDCTKAHGGVCPVDEDEDCAMRLTEWLGQECVRERLIKETKPGTA